MAHITANTSARDSVFANLRAFLADTAKSFVQFYQYRKTLNELAKLNDRELEDLGMSRGEITSIATKAVYGL